MEEKEKVKEKNYFNIAFWTTIILIFIVTIGLLVLGEFRASGDMGVANTQNVDGTSNQVNVPVHDIPGPVLLGIFQKASEFGEEQGLKVLDEQIDLLFEPVYAGITDYSDFHYSVLGEYSELFSLAIKERMGDEIEGRMFEGFNQRVENLGVNIDSAFREAFEESVKESTIESISLDQQADTLGAVTQIVIDDVIERSKITVPAASMTAFAGVSATKVISKGMAQAVVSKIGVKFAAKGVLKASLGLGGAGAGAAAGSFLGPLGAAAGGVVGALVFFFSADAVIINIDQYFNQEEFENDLRASVQLIQTDLRNELKGALGTKRKELDDFTLNQL